MTLPTEPKNGDFASYVEALSRGGPTPGQAPAKPQAQHVSLSPRAAPRQDAPAASRPAPAPRKRARGFGPAMLAAVLWLAFSKLADALRHPFELGNYLPTIFLFIVAGLLARAWWRRKTAS
jgi:hypothetical protein